MMSYLPVSTSSSISMKPAASAGDRKSTRLNSSHLGISYAVFCLKKKNHLKKAHCNQHSTTVAQLGAATAGAPQDSRPTASEPPDTCTKKGRRHRGKQVSGSGRRR